MSLKKDILAELKENGGFVSGEALARQFSKSRAAVWKAVKALRKDGYVIEAVTNRGYRFSSENDILSADIIKSRLSCGVNVYYYDSIDSTNTQAKRLISEGDCADMLLVADEQTNGRGRQGKSFYSPAQTGIYMTLVIHPDIKLQNAVTATTAASVAVCRAIEGLTDLKPKIKWVNDVYLNGRKICGILTEAVSDFETGTVSSVIIGIGMNISTVNFPSDVENAGSLGVNVRRADLIAEIANELMKITLGDYKSFIDYYRSRSLILGKKITYIENSKAVSATALEIDEAGGLTVRKENGEILTLRSGEISIRKA